MDDWDIDDWGDLEGDFFEDHTIGDVFRIGQRRWVIIEVSLGREWEYTLVPLGDKPDSQGYYMDMYFMNKGSLDRYSGT